MRIELAYISGRRQQLKSGAAQSLLAEFVKRSVRYTPVELVPYSSEAALLAALQSHTGRTPALLVLLDSRGENLTSEAFAEHLLRWRDDGQQRVMCAVGPPDGWSAMASGRAHLRLAFGAVTLPHELALVILAEQVYRALTLHAGHPYHAGHR